MISNGLMYYGTPYSLCCTGHSVHIDHSKYTNVYLDRHRAGMAVKFLNALLKLSRSIRMKRKILNLALFGMQQLEIE